MNLISQIVSQIDSAVLSAGSQYFQATASSVLTLYTALLGILFAFLGIALAMNVFAVDMRDAFQIGTRIALVFTFGLSWANFSILYDALTNTSQNMALGFFAIGGAGLPLQPDAAMDQFATDMANIVDAVTQSMSSIVRGMVGALLYAILALLMAAYVLIVSFSKLMIAFLLGVAPLAAIFTIFERTKSLFEAWLSAFIGYLMYPVAAAGIIGTVINVSTNYNLANSTPGGGVTLGSILGFLVIIFVGFFALWSIPQAVSNITGQFNLAGITPQALKVAGLPLMAARSDRARNFASGMIYGKTERMAQHQVARSWAGAGAKIRDFPGETSRKIGNYLTRKSP